MKMNLIITLLLAVLSISISSQMDGADKTAADLVAELGSSDYDTRQNATAELLKMGFTAREDVMKSLNSKDPETKKRAKEVWKSLRWMAFPKAGNDVSEAISKMSVRDSNKDIWENLSSKYGIDLLYLILEMSKDSKYSNFSYTGFNVLLDRTEATAIAAEIDGCRDPVKKDELLAYVRSIHPAKLGSTSCYLKMIDLLKKFQLYQDAFVFSKNAFNPWEEVLIHGSAEIVREGKLGEKIWTDCPRDIQDGKDQVAKENIAVFYIYLAGEMSSLEPIKVILDSIGGKFTDKNARENASKVLLKQKMYPEVLLVNGSADDPVSLYLKSSVLSGLGRKDEADTIWSNLLPKINSEEECDDLARFMESVGDDRAEKAWDRILEIGNQGRITNIVVNAYEHLSICYEKRGEYGKAADFLEKHIVEGSKTSGGFFVRTPSGELLLGESADKYYREKIAELRKKEKDKKQK